MRDAKGVPTGVLKDAAMTFVQRVIPKMSEERRLRVIRNALEHAASVGVTSVQDMNPSYDDLAAYAELANRGELTTRIYAAPMETDWYDQAKIGVRRAFGSPCAADRRGQGLRRRLARRDDGVFLPAVHGHAEHARPALGRDAADRQHAHAAHGGGSRRPSALHSRDRRRRHLARSSTCLRRFSTANGDRDRRFRIEHAQHIAPKDFDRFASLKVIASMQPYHAIDDGRLAERRIGPERIKTTYAFKTLSTKACASRSARTGRWRR